MSTPPLGPDDFGLAYEQIHQALGIPMPTYYPGTEHRS